MSNNEFQAGDIFACYGTDRVSRAITLGTFSLLGPRGLHFGPAHVAIACPENGSQLWIESTTLSNIPCVVTSRTNPSGAQAHFPDDRIQEYTSQGGRVEVYRLTPIFRLQENEANRLTRMLLTHFVRKEIPYDLTGALVSGTRVLRLSTHLVSDVSSLFCSEMIAAVLMRVCRLPIQNPTRYNPARLVRELVRSGVYRLHDTHQKAVA